MDCVYDTLCRYLGLGLTTIAPRETRLICRLAPRANGKLSLVALPRSPLAGEAGEGAAPACLATSLPLIWRSSRRLISVFDHIQVNYVKSSICLALHEMLPRSVESACVRLRLLLPLKCWTRDFGLSRSKTQQPQMTTL